ncbi:hypothetical protein P3T20_004046 [Paraburkholderia sp. GAS206C]
MKYVSVVSGLIIHGDYILVGEKVDHDHAPPVRVTFRSSLAEWFQD